MSVQAETTTAPKSDRSAPLLVYFGHHKCASTYVVRVLKNLARILDLSFSSLSLPQSLPLNWQERDADARRRTAEALEMIARPAPGILSIRNSEQIYLERLAVRPFRGFHVIRDPRDIVVSGYFSHLHSHPASEDVNPWMVEHRARLTRADKEAGLLYELEYSSTYFEHMARWNYHHPHVYETRFEVLTTRPLPEFLRILAFLGIEVTRSTLLARLHGIMTRTLYGPGYRGLVLPLPRLEEVLQTQSFVRQAGGRALGEEDVTHHFRKGVAGDWRNHFTPRLAAIFNERFGDLLIKLGYEADHGWQSQLRAA